ncbi:hypothetical protein AVEN_135835-1, partial [Araneus ventricosus]
MRSKKQTERQLLLMESSLAYPRGKEENSKKLKGRQKTEGETDTRDPGVSDLAFSELSSTVKFRFRKQDIDDNDIGNFLSGEAKALQFNHSNLWTCARMASARQGIRWEFVDKEPRLIFGDLVLKASNRKKILFSLRDRLKLLRGDSLLAKPDQGKVIE